MANVELDVTIRNKLKDAFKVCDEDIRKVINFFNTDLKPALKAHYLSHLVTSIEEMINEKEKKEFLKYIKSTGNSDENIATLTNLVNERRVRMFSIILVPIKGKNRKALTLQKQGGAIIYYANYLQENEKRFAIAHELGHIVNNYLLNISLSDTQQEYAASLFAYIALIDKNNFYQNEAQNYIARNDIELFNEYMNILHISEKTID